MAEENVRSMRRAMSFHPDVEWYAVIARQAEALEAAGPSE